MGPALPLQQGEWCPCQAAAVWPAWGVLWKAAALAPRLACAAPTCGSPRRKGRTFLLSSLGLGCGGGGRGCDCSSAVFLRSQQAVFGFLCFCPVKSEGFFMAVMVCSSFSGLWECAWMCGAGSPLQQSGLCVWASSGEEERGGVSRWKASEFKINQRNRILFPFVTHVVSEQCFPGARVPESVKEQSLGHKRAVPGEPGNRAVGKTVLSILSPCRCRVQLRAVM